MNPLFRPEAGKNVVRPLEGSVIQAAPLSFRLLSVLAAVMVIAAALFASLATYSRKETVDGWLTPGAGLIRAGLAKAALCRRSMSRKDNRSGPGSVWLPSGCRLTPRVETPAPP
jgi:hypothetical protein